MGGDILVEMDGEPVAASEDLARRIERKRVGDSVGLTFFRGRRRLETAVRLEARPAGR